MKTKTYEDNHFVSKEPCPECGSRDNLARYSDGHAYCFGCGHREPAKTDWDKIESMVAKAYNKLEVVPLEKMTAIYRTSISSGITFCSSSMLSSLVVCKYKTVPSLPDCTYLGPSSLPATLPN